MSSGLETTQRKADGHVRVPRGVKATRVSISVLAAACIAALGVSAGSGFASPARTGEVAIFYYPWYSNPARDGSWAHWYVDRSTGGAPTLSTHFYPTRGLYSSSSAQIVNAQMQDIATAGIRTVVVSWWGTQSPEAARLPLVMTAAARYGLRIAIHIEPYPGRTPASTAANIAALQTTGVTDFYVYDADRDPAAGWADALAGLDGVRVFGQTTLVGRAKASGFDGLYTYDVGIWTGRTFARLCTQAHRLGLLCAPSVGPGFDARIATGDELVRPRLDGATYDHMWRAAVHARADLVTVTSYNEWQEGTQIEPARSQVGRRGYDGAWGTDGRSAQRSYLQATARWAARFHVLPSQ
jgi:glycoprotein endo-alpha-1,2-mannosidase